MSRQRLISDDLESYSDWYDFLTRNDVIIFLKDLSNPVMYEYWDKEGILNVILEHTYTCLTDVRHKHYDWGIGCGECDLCIARKKAYDKFITNKYK